MQNEGSNQWPTPLSRDVGLFTDLRLYAEALSLAVDRGTVSVSLLDRELGERLQKMRQVQRYGKRTLERLLRELSIFKWLEVQQGAKLSLSSCAITDDGRRALNLSKEDASAFRRLLAVKMQQVYVIPGWFIARLWAINPEGQGELIIPAPLPDWHPPSRRWEDKDWSASLLEQTLATARHARKANAGAFPVQDDDWLAEVQHAWNRLSDLKPRGRRKQRPVSYTPRARLTRAMQEAAVNLFFNNVPYGGHSPDFQGARPPIYPRTYMNWCPRLETLELIFYTDWHPLVSGRLLFPLGAFRGSAPSERFEELELIIDPQDVPLWLHQPSWEGMRLLFLRTLIETHQRLANRIGTIYISLLNVRDEVCRLLRVSSLCFDNFMEQAIRELPCRDFPWSVAVETDIREEQRSGAGQLRRPVYLDDVPHSLIGLAPLLQE